MDDTCYCAQCGQPMPGDQFAIEQPVMATEDVVSFPFPPVPASNVIQFPRRPVMVPDSNDDIGRFAQDMTIRARPGITLAVIDEAKRLESEALKQRIAEEEWSRIAAEEDLI